MRTLRAEATLSGLAKLGVTIALLGAVARSTGVARADAAAVSTARPEPAFGATFLGAFGEAGVATGQAGNMLLGQVGPRSFGLVSARGSRWLVQWDLFLAPQIGYIKTAGPLTQLSGLRALAGGAIGYRLRPEPWSCYVGVRERFDGRWLHTGARRLPLNEMVGVNGMTVDQKIHLDMGASYLDAGQSLLLLSFVRQTLRPTDADSGMWFTEVGLDARYDIASRLTASLEASWGRSTTTRRDAALGLSDQTTHEEIAATLRAGFFNGSWFALTGNAARNMDHIEYAGGRSYDTKDAPNLGATVSFGAPLGT